MLGGVVEEVEKAGAAKKGNSWCSAVFDEAAAGFFINGRVNALANDARVVAASSAAATVRADVMVMSFDVKSMMGRTFSMLKPCWSWR